MFAATWLGIDLLQYQYRLFLHVCQQYWNEIHLQSQLFHQPPLNIKYFPCHFFFFSWKPESNYDTGGGMFFCFCFFFSFQTSINGLERPRTNLFCCRVQFKVRGGGNLMKLTCTVQETAKIPNIIFIKTCWVTVRCAQAMLQKILFNMLVKEIKLNINYILKQYRTVK